MIHPGKDPGGVIVTILLGLAGSLLGFLVFTELLRIGDNKAFDFGGIIGAVIGTLLLLIVYRQLAPGEKRSEEPLPPSGV